MFSQLEQINARPKPFEFYTANDLWTDEYTSEQMLAYHLNENIDVSSRNARFIDRSVDWIASRFNIVAGTKIADFGCGPGLYAIRLARKQADLTGIDFSKRSIQYACEVASSEGLSIQYLNQNYLEFETDSRFNLVLMIMCDFCALSPLQRNKVLRTFYTILEPGGSVLFDVYSLTAFDQRDETATYQTNILNGFWSPKRYYGFLNTFKYHEEKLILDKYTIVEEKRTRVVYNWLQHFTTEKLEKELTECGFNVEAFYSDVAGATFDPTTPEFAVVGMKP